MYQSYCAGTHNVAIKSAYHTDQPANDVCINTHVSILRQRRYFFRQRKHRYYGSFFLYLTHQNTSVNSPATHFNIQKLCLHFRTVYLCVPS
jgi:hypothetical protein